MKNFFFHMKNFFSKIFGRKKFDTESEMIILEPEEITEVPAKSYSCSVKIRICSTETLIKSFEDECPEDCKVFLERIALLKEKYTSQSEAYNLAYADNQKNLPHITIRQPEEDPNIMRDSMILEDEVKLFINTNVLPKILLKDMHTLEVKIGVIYSDLKNGKQKAYEQYLESAEKKAQEIIKRYLDIYAIANKQLCSDIESAYYRVKYSLVKMLVRIDNGINKANESDSEELANFGEGIFDDLNTIKEALGHMTSLPNINELTNQYDYLQDLVLKISKGNNYGQVVANPLYWSKLFALEDLIITSMTEEEIKRRTDKINSIYSNTEIDGSVKNIAMLKDLFDKVTDIPIYSAILTFICDNILELTIPEIYKIFCVFGIRDRMIELAEQTPNNFIASRLLHIHKKLKDKFTNEKLLAKKKIFKLRDSGKYNEYLLLASYNIRTPEFETSLLTRLDDADIDYKIEKPNGNHLFCVYVNYYYFIGLLPEEDKVIIS